MGKKKNKLKIQGAFLNDNKVLLAALGGLATGITLASVFGIDKAKKVADAVTDSVSNLSIKLKDKLTVEEPDSSFKHKKEKEKELVS